jgi:ADP-heptose:LPS heptosyltransferase
LTISASGPDRVNAPRKRLLIRPGAIGDFIVSLPALQHLKAAYTEVWCASQNVALARFADRALSIHSAGLNRIGVLAADDVFHHLRSFDEIVSWYGTANEEFREAVRGLPFRFFAAVPPATTRQNATEFFCAQVGAPDTLPRIDTGIEPREGFVILHPFASSPTKRWPLEHYRRLAEMLGEVSWCAGPGEVLDNAVRLENLFELARWIARARAYVGNDSGITHLAAAVGTPVVALFGPTDPVIWSPRGPQVRVVSGTSLPSISPKVVFDVLASLV